MPWTAAAGAPSKGDRAGGAGGRRRARERPLRACNCADGRGSAGRSGGCKRRGQGLAQSLRRRRWDLRHQLRRLIDRQDGASGQGVIGRDPSGVVAADH